MPTAILRAAAFTLVATLVLVLTGCPEPRPPVEVPVEADDPVDVEPDPLAFTTVEEVLAAHPEATAAALVEPVGEGQVRGYVVFQEIAGRLQVEVDLAGLEPGRRGFHVHEHGSCEPGPDGTPAGAAGGHFDPFDRPHGGPGDPAEERHAGDFGNLHVADDGTARITFTDHVAMLEGEAGIIGRAVVIHAQQDDLATQPAGEAGPRIGCGIITARENAGR